jgi:hypothetical protein
MMELPWDGMFPFVPLLQYSVVWLSFWEATYLLDILMKRLKNYNIS